MKKLDIPFDMFIGYIHVNHRFDLDVKIDEWIKEGYCYYFPYSSKFPHEYSHFKGVYFFFLKDVVLLVPSSGGNPSFYSALKLDEKCAEFISHSKRTVLDKLNFLQSFQEHHFKNNRFYSIDEFEAIKDNLNIYTLSRNKNCVVSIFKSLSFDKNVAIIGLRDGIAVLLVDDANYIHETKFFKQDEPCDKFSLLEYEFQKHFDVLESLEKKIRIRNLFKEKA